ncbi:hypothetical protein DRQ50_04780, partial [bacterium]
TSLPLVAAPRTEPVSPIVRDTTRATIPVDSVALVADEPAVDEAPVAEVARESEPVTEPQETAAAPARPTFDPTPYQGVVGADGWTLHLYSFPDSTGAAAEVGILARRGIKAAVRTVEIAGKGRYHRVYVGSFADRTAAREAMSSLMDRLGADWANPVRFGSAE